MGGSMGGVFGNQPQGATDPTTGKKQPSFLQNLVQGTAKGAGTAFGRSGQPQQAPDGGAAPAPAPTPVDPRFFQPTNFRPAPALPGGGSGAPASSPFYG